MGEEVELLRDRVKKYCTKLSDVESEDPMAGWYRCLYCNQKIYYSKFKPQDGVRHADEYDCWD